LIVNSKASKQNYLVNLPVLGVHNVANALAVFGAITALGLNPDPAIEGLANMPAVNGRLHKYQLGENHILLDDTYNANPSSMVAAFKVLANYEGKKIVVLGDMAELGEDAAILHEQTAIKAKDEAMDWLFCIGKFSQDYMRGFGENTKAYNDKASLVKAILDYIALQDTKVNILIKGSRSSQMDDISKALVSHFDHLRNEQVLNALPIQE
jgi:UDP-N-acetylmuramoyl-tripeptide--D-alanyl-D-alanine ligase